MMEVRELSAAECRGHLNSLASVLQDCVEGGASVGFLSPFSLTAASSFFESVIPEIERGNRILLAAFIDSALVGTVQLVTRMPANQPHRAEVAKLLVLGTVRGQGVGAALMKRLERAASAAGKTLLVLDTVTGASGERLYSRLGWVRAGVIPKYALFPHGAPCDTSVFWKEIAAEPEG